MLKDRRGLVVTGATQKALEHFETALAQYQSYVGDPIASIDQALAEAPGFVMGHVFRAGALATLGEQRFQDDVCAASAAAEALATRASERERGLIAAVGALAERDLDRACRGFERVLVDHPRDIFAIQTAHLLDFFRGDALNLRSRIQRVLPHWSPSVPGYSYLLGMLAFGLEECNEYAAAEATGRRALELQSKDAWAVHAVAHVMEMQGRIDEGIDWLESRVQDWAPDNGFAFHNYWHLALYRLDRGDDQAVLTLYDSHVRPAPCEMILPLIDATAMLWRLQLEGVDIGTRAQGVADDWAARIQHEAGFYAFNDFHAMLAFSAAGREGARREVLAQLEHAAQHALGSNRRMAAIAGLPLARGIDAFARGRDTEAIELLAAARDGASAFGGSHAQRDLVTLTLIHAALRAGQRNLARHYIAERLVRKPASAWGWRLAARADAQSETSLRRAA